MPQHGHLLGIISARQRFLMIYFSSMVKVHFINNPWIIASLHQGAKVCSSSLKSLVTEEVLGMVWEP